MRVLFQLLDSGIGGGQLVASRVAGALGERGHGLGLLVPGPGPAADRFAALGAELHTVPVDSLRRPGGVISAARVLRRYDLLYTHTSVPGAILAGAAARLAGRPLVVHQHAAPYFSSRPPVAAAQRLLLRRALASATVVVVAEHIGAALAAAGVGSSRVSVLANGVPLPDLPVRPPDPGAALVIGTLARLDPGKNVHVFVEAARRAAALLAPGLRARFVAGVEPGPYPEYEAEVRAAAAAAGVELVSPGGDGLAFLRGLDVVVLPTAAEGSPLTLLEAMGLGRAVVASDIPGIREVVEHGVSGLLAPPGDAGALAAAIASLGADPVRRAVLGAAARALVEERYRLDAMLERACTILEDAARG